MKQQKPRRRVKKIDAKDLTPANDGNGSQSQTLKLDGLAPSGGNLTINITVNQEKRVSLLELIRGLFI